MNALVPTSNQEAYRASTDAATLCKEIVVATAMNIQGRKYVKVEGWQSIAVAHGCTASAREVERIDGGVRAIGEIRRISDGLVIAEAEGFVGEDEPTWFGGKMGSKTLPKRADYAIRAMAQTRAISRACRSAFAHVVVMMNAGLSTTPAEEVPLEGFDEGAREVPADGQWKPGEPMAAHNARKSSAQAKRDGDWTALMEEIHACPDSAALDAWAAENMERINALPTKWVEQVQEKYDDRLNELRAVEDGRKMDRQFAETVG